MNHRDERGSITAFVAVVAAALVMVAGMAYDGGQVIAAHSAARSDAERAARAGAQQILTYYAAEVAGWLKEGK